MSHNFTIQICKYVIETNEISSGSMRDKILSKRARLISYEDETTFDYIWANLSKICPEHFLEDNGECPLPRSKKCDYDRHIHIWDFRYDCDGRQGKNVKIRILEALEILDSYGIIPAIPDNTKNENWYRGYYTDGELDRYGYPKERYSVFAYHLKYLLTIAEKYPDYYFIGPDRFIWRKEDRYIIDDDGIYIRINNQNNNNSLESKLYFDHPYKGKFNVKNFQSAIEVFSIVSMKNSADEKAEKWYNMAMEMSDVPGYYFDHPTKGRMKIYNFKTAMEAYGLSKAQGNINEANKWYMISSTMPDSPYYNN